MTFFNPAQMQSQMNSPYFAQMMQQAGGGGAFQQSGIGGQPQNMAPQIPLASPQQGAGMSPTAGAQAPQAQPGFFQQMMSSPQSMSQGVSGLTGLAGMGSSAMSGLGSLIGTTAGAPLAGAAMGPTMGSGIMGAMTGGSTGLGGLDALLAFL